MKLEREIIPEKIFCDIVSEELEVLMYNKLGPSDGDKKIWAEFNGLAHDTKSLLERCSGGCILNIAHDEDSEEAKSNARATYPALDIAEPQQFNCWSSRDQRRRWLPKVP